MAKSDLQDIFGQSQRWSFTKGQQEQKMKENDIDLLISDALTTKGEEK